MAERGALWREPDFLKLWAGETISLLGTQVSSLAIPLTAIALLNVGPNQLGLLRTAEFLPFIVLTLLAGTWADRHRRRPLMIAANLLRAALLLAVPLLAWTDRLELWHLYGIVALVGVGAVFFDLSYLSYLPSLVRREHLVEGNSKLAVSASVAEVGGPGLAGLLVQALTAPIAILVDAASYLASAASLLTIRTREPEPARAGRTGLRHLRSEIAEGLRVVLANRYLRAIAGEAFTYNLFVQFAETLFLLYAVEQLRYQPGAVGLILSGAAVGGLLGSVMAQRVVGRAGFGPTFLWSTALACAAPVLVPLASGPRPLVTAMIVRQLLYRRRRDHRCGGRLHQPAPERHARPAARPHERHHAAGQLHRHPAWVTARRVPRQRHRPAPGAADRRGRLRAAGPVHPDIPNPRAQGPQGGTPGRPPAGLANPRCVGLVGE